MPKGKKGVTESRQEEILLFIKEELLLGRTIEEIRDKVRRKAPTVAPTTIKAWIERVVDVIGIVKKESSQGKGFLLGLADQRLHDLYRRALDAKDLKLAFMVEKQRIRLHGLEARRAERKPPMTMLANHVQILRGSPDGLLEQSEELVSRPPQQSIEDLRRMAGVEEPQDAEYEKAAEHIEEPEEDDDTDD